MKLTFGLIFICFFSFTFCDRSGSSENVKLKVTADSAVVGLASDTAVVSDIGSIKSVITCAVCGFKSEEKMPTDQCLIFYNCKNCGHKMAPKNGDCCVFCSYGTVKCPSKQ